MPLPPGGTAGPIGGGFLQLSLKTDGFKECQRYLSDMNTGVKDLSQPLESFGKYMLQKYAKRFETEMGRDEGWAELAPSTVMDRIRKGYPGEHPILVRTGELKKSYTEEGGFGNVFLVSPNKLEVGSGLAKASYHHRRGPHGRPARQAAYLTKDDIHELIQLVHTYIYQLAKAGKTAMFRARTWLIK